MDNEKIPDNRLGISFSIRRGRLLIYHSVIRALGEPEHIRFLLNSRDKHIAVQACEPIDQHSFRVPKSQEGELFQFEISSSPLLSVLYKQCEWDVDKTFLVYGKEYQKNRLIDFDLSSAAVISPDEFIDPENRGQ